MKKQDNSLTWIIIAVLAVFLFWGFGMMGNYYYKTNYLAFIFNILLIVGLVFLIIWLSREIFEKKKRKRK